MHGGDPGKSVVSFELEYRFKGNQKKKNSHVLSSIPHHVIWTRSGGKSIKEHHYEVLRRKTHP